MMDDQQLLHRHVEGSADAFGELVARYVNLVYSTALRRADGDAELAKDVAQLVFTDLARKARSLPKGVVLAGWLHRASRYATAQLLRTERRRRAREQEAVAMNALNSEASPDWRQIHPLLDEALDELGRTDRDALLLRFFDQGSLAGVGRTLGLTEDAARKRVARALEKLRASLIRRGVTTTAAALSTVLTVNAVQGAPAGLAAALTNASLASAAAGTGLALGIMEVITMTKLQAGVIGAIVVACVVTPLVIQHQSAVRLREENQLLRQQVNRLSRVAAENKLLAQAKRSPAPRMPAPPLQAAPPPAPFPTDDLQATNLYARLANLNLTAEQLTSYLKANRRDAASLLAAYHITGDASLLEEAMRRYPNDPQVAFDAVFKKDAKPEERHQWLEAFKRSDPDNALANYLSALDYFKAGMTDQAVQELIAADAKPQFEDFSLDFIQNAEEADLAAGCSVAEAKALAFQDQSPLSSLRPLRELVRDYMVALANSYRQAGDEQSAVSVLEMGVNLGQRFKNGSPGKALVIERVGMDEEYIALGAMDPSAPYGNNGQTVQDRRDQILQQQEAFKALNRQFIPIEETMTDQDWISYTDRIKTFGHEAAMRWLVSKYGQE